MTPAGANRLACGACSWESDWFTAPEPPPEVVAEAASHAREAHDVDVDGSERARHHDGHDAALLERIQHRRWLGATVRVLMGFLAVLLALLAGSNLQSGNASILLGGLLLLALFRLSRWGPASIGAVFAAAVLIVPARYTLGPFAATPAMLIGIAAIGLWVAGKLIGRSFWWGRHPVGTAVFYFLFTVMLGYVAAHLRVLSGFEAKAADRKLIILLSAVGVCLLLADGVRSTARIRVVIGVIVFGGAVMASVGIAQFTTGYDVAAELRPPGFNADIENLDFIKYRQGFRRVAGTALHAIEFGVACAMILPLAIHLAATARSLMARRLSATAALLLAVGIPMSVSRSAILAVAVVLVMLVPFWPSRIRFKVSAGAVAAAFALSVAAPGLVDTVRDLFEDVSSDASVTDRTTDLDPIFEYVAETPLIGRGYGTFDPQEYFFVDNQYLLTLVETGVVGISGLLVLLMIGPVVARRIRQATDDDDVADLTRALSAIVVIAAVACALFDLFSFRIVTGLLFVALGLLGAMYRITYERLDDSTEALASPVGVPPQGVLERA